MSVSGERVGEAAQQNEDQRKEVMVITQIVILSSVVLFKSGSNKTKFNHFLFQDISKNLLEEIEAFGKIALEQRARLEVRELLVSSDQQCFVPAGINNNSKWILNACSFKHRKSKQ